MNLIILFFVLITIILLTSVNDNDNDPPAFEYGVKPEPTTSKSAYLPPPPIVKRCKCIKCICNE